MYQLDISIISCFWLGITNLIGLYPIIIFLGYDYILGAITTFFAMSFSILWHLNEHKNGYHMFVYTYIFFVVALFGYELWMMIIAIIASTFITTKIIFPLVCIAFLIASKVILLQKNLIGGIKGEIMYVLLNTIAHILMFLSVVVMIPQNETWYPSLFV